MDGKFFFPLEDRPLKTALRPTGRPVQESNGFQNEKVKNAFLDVLDATKHFFLRNGPVFVEIRPFFDHFLVDFSTNVLGRVFSRLRTARQLPQNLEHSFRPACWGWADRQTGPGPPAVAFGLPPVRPPPSQPDAGPDRRRVGAGCQALSPR